MCEQDVQTVSGRSPRKVEAILLALVLVAAYHAIPRWFFQFLPVKELYERLGEGGFANLWDSLSAFVPFLLCISIPSRSGLRIGEWHSRGMQILGICALPVVLTAIIYPFTSQPFAGGHIGVWLISPIAQDLLFTGYLYGLLEAAFPGTVGKRLRINRAVFLTAVFFSLWHVPNLAGIPVPYVLFQLVYTLVGGAWVLLARQLTGSTLPGIATHMAVNFLAWAGW